MSGLNFPSIDQAIANFEGFGQVGAPATDNNNPGNLVAGAFANAHGAVGTGIGGFALFPDVATGQAAEDANVSYYAGQGDTISDLITSWAPPNAKGNSQEKTNNYINYVASQVGGTPTSKVSQFGNSGGSQPASSAPSSSNSSPSIVGTLGNIMTQGLWGLSFTQVVAIMLGLIAVAGAIFLYKDTGVKVIKQTGTYARGRIAAAGALATI